MQLYTITDKEAWGREVSPDGRDFEYRASVRLILRNSQGKIALIFNGKDESYAIVGGGIELNEDTKTALKREAIEETGCAIKNIKELISVLEVRYKAEATKGKVQLNHIFFAEVDQVVGPPSFDKNELLTKSELLWYEINNAKNKIKNMKINHDYMKFSQIRDLKAFEIAEENGYLANVY